MKNIRFFPFFIISTICLLVSCSDNELIDTYQLKKVHSIDWGNSSNSTFAKRLLFYKDGTIEIVNGDICSFGDRQGTQVGIYDKFNQTITTEMNGCNRTTKYDLSDDGNMLYIEYPGIEFSDETYELIY